MKKVLSILLLFVFMGNIFGSYLLFSIRQYSNQLEIEHQIISRLKDDELTVIPANDIENIHFTKPDKEFRYQGEMYDIVRTEYNGPIKLNYYCIRDKKENTLIADYNKMHRNTRNRHLNKLVRIHLFFQSKATTKVLTSSDMLYTVLFCKLIKCYISVPSPPPKLF